MPRNIPREAAARFRILAPAPRSEPQLVTVSRCSGAVVSLYEWRCTGHDAGAPADEYADAFEVVVPRHGAFEWQIDGAQVLADPGSATFLHPFSTYRVRHPIEGGDAGTVFRLPEATARGLLAEGCPEEDDRPPRLPVTRVPLDGRAYLLHRLALQAARTPGTGALEIEERALAFLRSALSQAWRPRARSGRSSPGPLAREYVARVTEVVAARYREPLTLGEIAAAAGVSPFHLARVVAAATGVPVYRMVIRRRLGEALELVLSTRESLARIALAVGFASHSHLTDAFRREYGSSPSELRRATSPRR